MDSETGGRPEERESLQRELVGVSPDRMLRELGEFLHRYTDRRPLLVLTEDLQWVDYATIQLIDYFARRRGGARVMWLSRFRLTEVVISNQPLNAVRHEMRVHDLCEEIVLDPLSETEVAAYLAKRSLSVTADERFVRALHERTDGLPLFVVSITNDVIARAEERGIEVGETEFLADLPVPEDLTAIIDHYLHRLDYETALTALRGCRLRCRLSQRHAGARAPARWDACHGGVRATRA